MTRTDARTRQKGSPGTPPVSNWRLSSHPSLEAARIKSNATARISAPYLAACRAEVWEVWQGRPGGGEDFRLGDRLLTMRFAVAGSGRAECEHPLQVPCHGHKLPLATGGIEPAQQELPEPQHGLDDAEHWLGRLLA